LSIKMMRKKPTLFKEKGGNKDEMWRLWSNNSISR
jgi:hypothetical protein